MNKIRLAALYILIVEELEAAKSDVKARIRRRLELGVKARIRYRKSRDEG